MPYCHGHNLDDAEPKHTRKEQIMPYCHGHNLDDAKPKQRNHADEWQLHHKSRDYLELRKEITLNLV
jgi:hypothetical protein